MQQKQPILELLKSQQDKVDYRRFPDFFVLGPQCTGTNWMYKNLSEHPDIFMTTPKELFFFTVTRLEKFVGREQDFDLNDYMAYFNQPWWRRAPLSKQMVMGEATASYAWQPLVVIRGIVCLNPRLKGIILVRDPVEKVWSNLRRKMVSERGFDDPRDVPDGQIEQFIHDPHQISCAMFSKMIENWSQNLVNGNLFVGGFTDLVERPAELLLDLFRFLGVRPERKYIPRNLSQKIRVAKELPMSDRWRMELEQIFQEERKRLRDLYGYDFTK